MSNIVTKTGLEKLKNELAEVKVKLKEVAVRIKEAKDLGDLSENAEYHEAKNEQAFLYGKAIDLEQKIQNATVIVHSESNGKIEAGCTVEVENEGDKMKFEIVGTDESDPLNGRISVDSPIGSALVGRKLGESIKISTPGGETEYKILSVA